MERDIRRLQEVLRDPEVRYSQHPVDIKTRDRAGEALDNVGVGRDGSCRVVKADADEPGRWLVVRG